ncbi:MAG: hypothetical protein R3308_09625, partial [Thiohalobacterales bacterium]|nr:hypothetical protein [Thiohalobacterales bacterium]
MKRCIYLKGALEMAAAETPTGREVAVQYRIRHGDRAREYVLHLDRQTGRLLNDPPADPPAWTRLDVQQCTNCPLSTRDHSHCPLSLQLAQVVADWGEVLSYEEVGY